MAKLNVKLGKSAGQKAAKESMKKSWYDSDADYSTGDGSAGGGGWGPDVAILNTAANAISGKWKRDADKADREVVKKVSKAAKVGKQKAKKALNMSEISDERLDEILNATGEKEDRARRRAGLLN